MSEITVVTVAGMSCEHCVRAVRDEVGAVAGVEDVSVDLLSGAVTVRSAATLDPEALRAAVEEAGYEVVS
jgi:copper chaperone CopZ